MKTSMSELFSRLRFFLISLLSQRKKILVSISFLIVVGIVGRFFDLSVFISLTLFSSVLLLGSYAIQNFAFEAVYSWPQ